MPRRRKDSNVHQLQGSFRKDRHGDGGGGELPPDQRLQPSDRLKYLKGRAAELWREELPRLPWLAKVDGPIFEMWCALMAEFEDDPAAMQTARLAQLRLITNDVGMTASARASIGVSPEPPPPGDDGADEYFKD